MASSSEVVEYSSPAKRRRVDCEEYGGSCSTNLDFGDHGRSCETPQGDPEDVLEGDDHFTELNGESKSAHATPNAAYTLPTSARIDSTSDDTSCPLDGADERGEVSSTVSNLSELSGLSELSRKDQWKPTSLWVQEQMLLGADSRNLLHYLLKDSAQIRQQVDDFTLMMVIVNSMLEPPRRQKITEINTLTDVVNLINFSKQIIVLTGAGVSVSCGIPDFRSRDGIYSRLAQDFPDLPNPQAMFDINYFAQDPRPFYKFAREIYPGQFKPSPCHRFIKMLEKHNKLLRNYSQNIDTLERVAGIENVIECHGSFATASCTRCKYRVKADDIREDIFAQRIPMCPKCKANALPSLTDTNSNENYRDLVSQGIMKPDIVFFGEGLPDAFHDAIAKDKDECDLLIVIGSSLKVRPVALIPSSIPPYVPQILINRESLPHLKFDVELLGDSDIIINQLCHLVGGSFAEICWRDTILKKSKQLRSPCFTTDDSWDHSQDTISRHELSQDSVEVDLKPRNVSSESQDSLMINANTTPKHMENTDICISPFHAGHMDNAEGNFTFLGESPKRRLGDSSVESSPKRMHFDSSSSDFVDSTSQSVDSIENKENATSRNSRVISVESTSENNGQILNLEECHVVPRMIVHSKDAMVDSTTESDSYLVSTAPSTRNGDATLEDCNVMESDKVSLKPRHVSVDTSVNSKMENRVGNNIDNIKGSIGTMNGEKDDSMIDELERHCWQPKVRESLATRLFENSYYQMRPGKYIFPGAEVYSGPEDYDWCSLSANSDTSESNSDSSSEGEEETYPDEDFSESVDADADADSVSESSSEEVEEARVDKGFSKSANADLECDNNSSSKIEEKTCVEDICTGANANVDAESKEVD